MICNNCKKEISETAMFCPNCGAANNQINNVENKIEEQAIINHPFNEIEQNIAVDNTINSNTQNNIINQQENYFEGQNIINHPFNETKQNIVIFPNGDNNELKQTEQQATINPDFNNNNINNVVNNNLNQINQPVTSSPTFNNNEQINTTTQEDTEEKVNVALAILSWFIPLVGIIIFFTQKGKKPKTAKVCGIVALINIAISFIITAISVAVLFSAKNDSYVKLENTTTTTTYNFTTTKTTTTTRKEESNSSSINNNWKEYKFIVNGTTLNLPCSFSELEKITNYKLNNNQVNDSLKPNYYTTANLYHNDKLTLYIEIYNDTTVEVKLTNGKIKRISQSQYQVSNNKISPIVFPGDLTVGMKLSKNELIMLFGKPSDERIYNGDGEYISEIYKYNEDELFTTRNYYEIKIVNGVIDELTIDNINY